MKPLKAQYFFAYSILGCVQPFLALYLRDVGLDSLQIGFVHAAASVAIILSPVLAALLADTKADPRRMIGWVYALSAATLLALTMVRGFVPVIVLYTLHCLVFVPLNALHDGLNFMAQESRARRGEPREPYHRVRVWGTVGFMLPSVVMFVLLTKYESPQIVVYAAIGCCVLGFANSFRLPAWYCERASAAGGDVRPRATLPTLDAARALAQPRALVFCVAMFLFGMAAAAYYGYYPIYLPDHAGIDKRWAGLIANLGVVVELFFMLGFARIEHRLGFRGLLTLGGVCFAARLALLWLHPCAATAVLSQLFHGMTVLVIHIVPPMYLNRLASDHFRSSIQGYYAMTVTGPSRLVGSLVAGRVSQGSVLHVFAWGAGLALLAAGLFAAGVPKSSHHPPAPKKE